MDSRTTYYQELAKLDAADQDAVLGPTLGKAFREMDNPDKFAKQMINYTKMEPLTITEMQAMDNELGRILRAQNG